jgi:hypothetical protein
LENTGSAEEAHLLLIHGLGSPGHYAKAIFLRASFPAIVNLDFNGSLDDWMAQASAIINAGHGQWILIG